MGRKEKLTREEMTDIAYELQDSIMAVSGNKRPIRITTNREHSIIRIVWMRDYERKEWYAAKEVQAVIDSFIEKYGIHIYEITKDRDKRTAVWLTKRGASGSFGSR